MATTVRSIRALPAPADHAAAELRIRRAVGWVLLASGALAMVAVAWDSTYHSSVGRHKFLTPPHWLLYSGVALAGLACLYLVANDTIRYRRRLGVDDGNSVPILRLFRAPIGVLLAGFGVLAMVISAPLDNYWHTLYGIFVHPWTPFHMMVQIGGGIWGLGNIYLWAALLAADRQAGRPATPMGSWAVVIAVMLMLRLIVIGTYPGLTLFQTAAIAGVRFMTYPTLLALAVPWLLLVVATTTGRRESPVRAGVLLFALALVIQIVIPVAVRYEASAEGRPFLRSALVPAFTPSRMVPDLAVLLAASALWAAFRRPWPNRWQSAAVLGALSAVPLWAIGAASAFVAARFLARVELPPGIEIGWLSTPVDGLVALPLSLAAGLLSGMLGFALSQVLRWNGR